LSNYKFAKFSLHYIADILREKSRNTGLFSPIFIAVRPTV